MPKFIPDANIDLQLEQTEGDQIHICSAQPTTPLEATDTFNLATQAIEAGDYVKSNGDTSGRKNTLSPPAGTNITDTGIGDHVAVTGEAGSVLKEVTTITAPQALTSGGTVDINPYSHEIQDVS